MALKYKVGDRIKIKSLDWYNKNKNKRGNISFPYEVEVVFTLDKSAYCGQVVTISRTGYTQGIGFYRIKEDYGVHMWTDEMIECRVEEETKFGTASNPIEIKSNANCLTRERVDETKSEPKFKVGDKITNGKDRLLILNIVSDKYIVEDNLGECGIVYFNTQDNWKLVEEEIDDCKKCGLVRNSTRCLSMDKCPYNKQRKFNVGDIVYSKTWQRNVIIHEILPGCFYKVGDLFSTNWFKEHEDYLCKELVKPTTEYTLPDGHIFKDENGNVINATKIVLEKKEYPKTYAECCRVLGVSEFEYNHTGTNVWYRHKLMATLDKLILCRNAYWKIAGEEMGLGKPWEPDWENDDHESYPAIVACGGKIIKSSIYTHDNPFAFPTPEMRDAFYENFKELIEQCKELL